MTVNLYIKLVFDGKKYCIDYNNYTSFLNDYTYPNSKFLHLEFSKCDKKVNKFCDDDETVINRLSEVYVTFGFADSIMNPTNYTNPYSIYENTNTQQCSIGILQRNFYRFGLTTIKTDNGLISSDNQIETISSLYSIKGDTQIKQNNPDVFYMLTLESPKVAEEYTRKYLKIPELLATIGGFLNIILKVGALITNYVAEKTLKLSLAKEFIVFKDINDIDDNDKNIQKPEINYLNSTSQIRINELEVIKFENTSKKSNLTKNATVNEIKKSNKIILPTLNNISINTNDIKEKIKNLGIKKQNIGFCDFMKTCCNNYENKISENNIVILPKNNEKSLKALIYDSLTHYFDSFLDIKNLITMHSTIEIMKFIMFDKQEHSDMFNYKISINEIIDFHFDKIQNQQPKYSELDEKELEEIENNQIKDQVKVKNKILQLKNNNMFLDNIK